MKWSAIYVLIAPLSHSDSRASSMGAPLLSGLESSER